MGCTIYYDGILSYFLPPAEVMNFENFRWLASAIRESSREDKTKANTSKSRRNRKNASATKHKKAKKPERDDSTFSWIGGALKVVDTIINGPVEQKSESESESEEEIEIVEEYPAEVPQAGVSETSNDGPSLLHNIFNLVYGMTYDKDKENGDVMGNIMNVVKTVLDDHHSIQPDTHEEAIPEANRSERKAEMPPNGSMDLQELLHQAIVKSVQILGTSGGFLSNDSVKIELPPFMENISGLLQQLNCGGLVNDFVATMNKAAEKATLLALPIFLKFVGSLSWGDLASFVGGTGSEVTEYFKAKMSGSLREAYTPVIEEALSQWNAKEKLEQLLQLLGSYMPSLLSSPINLTQYTTEGALAGLFTVLAEQEKNIRKDAGGNIAGLMEYLYSTNKQ